MNVENCENIEIKPSSSSDSHTPQKNARRQKQFGRTSIITPNRTVTDPLEEKLSKMSGPTYDLPPMGVTEKKYTNRNRLYVANTGSDITEEDLMGLFKNYGNIGDVFINKDKNFAFVKMDVRSNAERARRELDGVVIKSRNLKVRFAPGSSTVRVRNLTKFVTDELLHYAFSVFGEVDRARVLVDEKGNTLGEGLVDFAKKSSAAKALRECNERCFFLTSQLRPVIVEPNETVDRTSGYPDKNLNRHDNGERESGPRIPAVGSFEHEYGTRWKSLFRLYKQKEDALKKEFHSEMEKLEAQTEMARFEHETELLRERLRAREMDKERQKREWETKRRLVEEERMRNEARMRTFLIGRRDNLETHLDGQYVTPFRHTTVSYSAPFETHHRNTDRGRWVNENRREEMSNKKRRF